MSFSAARLIASIVLLAGTLSTPIKTASSTPIPAYARKYKTSCSTCHAAAPKLNVLGEAFRLNGYRFPSNDALLRKEDPVPLGAEPWKDLWPRAIYPGELPGLPPLSLRIVNDVQVTWDETRDYEWTYLFPEEIYVLAGGSLGRSISFFLEAEWTEEEGLEVIQAKVPFQDPLPFLPARSFNVWVGQQSLYLITLGERQIDRATRQRILWSEFSVSDLAMNDLESGDSIRSLNDLRLRGAQPGIEVNGLLGRRAYYALGLTQGSTGLQDDNKRRDVYYKVRYKFGGLALDGTYDEGGGPVVGTGGQLFDRTFVVEHFGYLGAFRVANDVDDVHRTFGVAGRWHNGPFDGGLGYVWGRSDNPFGLPAPLEITHWSAFAKAEYFVFPWFMASAKFEVLEASFSSAPLEFGLSGRPLEITRLMPGLVTLIRQNVRGVAEVEIFTRHSPSSAADLSKPNNIWLRLDVAF